MANTSMNVSESSFASILGVEGYLIILSVLLLVFVPVQIILNVITVAGLCTGKEFKKVRSQRNVMIFMSAMGLMSVTTVMMLAIAEYLFLHHQKSIGVIFCHAGSFFYYINLTMRNILLAVFSVTVFLIVKYGHKKVNVLYLNISLVVLVGIVLVLGIQYFIPSAVDYSSQFDGILCVARFKLGGYVGVGVAVMLTDIPCRIIFIVVIIATLAFVKKRGKMLSEDRNLKLAMVKLTVLLIILNIVVSLGNYIALVPVLVLPNVEDSTDFAAVAIFRQVKDFIFTGVSAILAPLLMIAVFKPLRTAIKMVLQRCCMIPGGKPKATMNSTITPGTYSIDNVN